MASLRPHVAPSLGQPTAQARAIQPAGGRGRPTTGQGAGITPVQLADALDRAKREVRAEIEHSARFGVAR